MRALRLSALLVTALLLAAPGCRRAPAAVTILHFNDVYEIEPLAGGRVGGLARVATLRAGLLKQGPVLTTLGGDYLSPSAIGTARVDGQALAGRQMVDVLNAVGLDWATFGNHEFDLQEPAFRQRMAEQKFRIVSSNVTSASGSIFDGAVRSAIVPVQAGGRERRIGLIGLTIDSTKKPWVKYLPVVDAAKAEIARLRASGPLDAVVALTHLKLDDDELLATEVQDIDVILGGHEHENWMLQRGARLTPIIKADANVRSIAVVTLAFDRSDGRPSVNWRLEPVDERVASDPAVETIARQWRTKAFDAFKAQGFSPEAVVATSTAPLDGRESIVRNEAGLLTDLITEGMRREVGGADVAILNGGSVRIDDQLPPGPVTEYDVIRILPFGGPVVKATFDGALLMQVLDIGLSNAGTGGYLQTAGVTGTNGKWQINGAPVDRTHRYTVAITDFLLTGGETNLAFLTRAHPAVRDIKDFRDVRLAFIAELKARFR
jgi:5'-nucleotidase/UDP-sugar diphosphatase